MIERSTSRRSLSLNNATSSAGRNNHLSSIDPWTQSGRMSSEKTNAEVSKMIQALPSNTKIVHIDFGNANSGLSSSQRKEFIQAIAQKNKTTLEQVRIVGGAGARRQSVRISHVAELLVSGLRVLNVRGVVFDGRPEDFAAFSFRLFQHRRLQEFCLQDFSLANKDKTFVDRVVQVLGLVPTLAVVKVEPAVVGSFSLEGSSLRGLLARSKRLRQLHLARFASLDQSAIELLAQTIKSGRTLEVLSLVQVGLKDADVAQLAIALEDAHNGKTDKRNSAGSRSVLQVLDMSSNSDIGNSSCLALAKSLEDNRSVQMVNLNGNKNIGKKGIAAMASMLRHNNTIQTIQMPLHLANAAGGGPQQQLHGGRLRDCRFNEKRTAKAA